jgi:hypothetical protein
VFWFTARTVWVGDLPDTKPPIVIVGLADNEVCDGESSLPDSREHEWAGAYCVVAPGTGFFTAVSSPGGDLPEKVGESLWMAADALTDAEDILSDHLDDEDELLNQW